MISVPGNVDPRGGTAAKCLHKKLNMFSDGVVCLLGAVRISPAPPSVPAGTNREWRCWLLCHLAGSCWEPTPVDIPSTHLGGTSTRWQHVCSQQASLTGADWTSCMMCIADADSRQVCVQGECPNGRVALQGGRGVATEPSVSVPAADSQKVCPAPMASRTLLEWSRGLLPSRNLLGAHENCPKWDIPSRNLLGMRPRDHFRRCQ